MKKTRNLSLALGLGMISLGGANTGCDSKPVPSSDTAGDPASNRASNTAGNSSTPPPLPTVLKSADVVRPIPLGGAPRPRPMPSHKLLPRAPAPARAPNKAPSSGATKADDAAAAATPKAAAAPIPAAPPAPAPAKPPGILRVSHNHPPGEACKPLSDAEIMRAFGDLKR